MTNMYSFGIPKSEGFIEVAEPDDVVDVLLDDRHLSRSALRALDVLDYLAQHPLPARATDVAHALGLSPSTADQLLKTLVSQAFLTFDRGRKRYWLAPRLLALTSALDQFYYGENRLRTLLIDLSAETGCPVAISTPFGKLMQLLDFAAQPGRPYDRMRGHVFPMFTSAAGNAILATWPITTVRELIEQCRDQVGALADTPDVILEHLSEVRANGHAFGGLSRNAEKCSIAIALPPARSGVELVLSVRGTIEELSAKRWRLSARMQDLVAERLRGPDER